MATTAERKAQRAKANPKPVTGPSGRDDIDLDEDLARFVIRQVRSVRTRANLASRILTGELERTMEGASTLTVTVLDDDHEVTRAGVLTVKGKKQTSRYRSLRLEQRSYSKLAAVDVQLDGVWFRLVNTTSQDGVLTLVFEDREIAHLRQHRRTQRRSRAKVTRAQFIHSLAREVKAGGGITFKSPDEAVKQKVADAQDDSSVASAKKSKTDRDADKDQGLASGARITVKNVRATAQQQRVIDDVLDVGRSMGATDRVLTAAVMVVTQESVAGKQNVSSSGQHVGAFHQDTQPGSTWRQLGGATGDVRKDAAAFFKRAKQVNDETNGSLSLEALAERVQVSGNPAGFAQWRSEAEKTVDSFTGGSAAAGSLDFGTKTRTYAKSYQYTVGQPGTPETYWDAMRRLADEVGWRLFMDRGTLWYVSDETLMRQRPRMTISERHPAVDRIDFALDRSERQWALEATVTAQAGRWSAPPGCVVQVNDTGDADGRWLVWSISRSVFDKQATIVLRRPVNDLAEPAHETSTSSTTTGTGGSTAFGVAGDTHVGKAYAASKAIDAKNYSYSYGGGHGSFSGPYDCSGFVSAVLHEAGLGVDTPLDTVALASWGEPGKGEHLTVWVKGLGGKDGHTFLEFHMPDGSSEFYEAGGTKGATTGQRTTRSTAGFQPRHWPGT